MLEGFHILGNDEIREDLEVEKLEMEMRAKVTCN